MALFSDFYHGKVDLSRINYGIITLIPKGGDAGSKNIDPFAYYKCCLRFSLKE